MTVRAQWFSRALVGCGLLVACQALVVSRPLSATTETPCEAMKRWAQAYKDERPTLEHLATFDRAHRVAIFNAVSPAVRAALWQEQLRRFSASPDLSAAQRALIAEGITLTTPALYARDATASQAFKQFWARAESSFTAPAHKRGWYDLGSTVSVHQSSVLPTSASYAVCNCQIGGGECGSCHTASCTPTSGCGPDGASGCDGRC